MNNDANLWPPPLRLNNDNTWHTWKRGDILYWRSFDENDANLEGFHVLLNAVPSGISEEGSRLLKTDGSGFFLDQYWIFNTVMLGNSNEIPDEDIITSTFVNERVEADDWKRTANRINEIDSNFIKHIQLENIPDEAPPFVDYTATAIEMTDEQIRTFKEEYVLAVEKRDADRQNQSYDDDDVNAPIFNSIIIEKMKTTNVDLIESVYADDNVKEKVQELLKDYLTGDEVLL